MSRFLAAATCVRRNNKSPRLFHNRKRRDSPPLSRASRRLPHRLRPKTNNSTRAPRDFWKIAAASHHRKNNGRFRGRHGRGVTPRISSDIIIWGGRVAAKLQLNCKIAVCWVRSVASTDRRLEWNGGLEIIPLRIWGMFCYNRQQFLCGVFY